MRNSRRGFLASLLALLPFARSVQAGSVKTGTIRLFNGSPQVGAGVVATSITSASQYTAINSGTYLDFQGTANSATAVSVLNFQDGSLFPATFTSFPAPGKIKTFSFYFTTNTTTGVKTTILVQV